jgi:hypothetical protein
MVSPPQSRPVLRVIEGSKPRVLDNQRVVVDFTRVCEVVGIIDSKTGLISVPPQGRSEPEG